jgi:hypothetical protein
MALLQGVVDKAYVSSIDFLDQREILNELLDVTSEEQTIIDIMELTGRMVPTAVPTYSQFTNDYVFVSGTISAVDATANGEAVAGPTNETLILTLGADEQLPVIGETALFGNKRQGRVTAVNTSTRVITVTPFSNAAADTLSPVGDTVVATQKVTFFSGSYGEGSDDPTTKKPRFVRSENQIQIFKEAGEITDLQKVSKTEVKFQGKDSVLYKVQHDTLLRHRAKIAYQFLIGKKANLEDADGNAIYYTQGLREYILHGDGTVLTSGGVDVPLSATIDRDDLRAMSRALDKRGAGLEYWMWNGGDIDADLDEVLTALEGVKNGIVYNSFGIGNGKNRALDLGVDSFRTYGRVFHKKKLAAFDHTEVFAPSTAFDFASESYLIPGGKTKVEGGGTVDALRTRYMSSDGTDFGPASIYKETLTGKLAPVPTNTRSVLHWSYESIMGLEALGIKQFGIFSKA